MEILAIRAKREMKHSNFAVRGRLRFLVRRKQGEPGISFANESWDTIPHAFVKSPEPENVDVPLRGALNVAHAHGYVINAFELHEKTSRIPSRLSEFYF